MASWCSSLPRFFTTPFLHLGTLSSLQQPNNNQPCQHFIIEGLSNDAPLGHVMIKATQLTMDEVTITESGKSITDKDFFYTILYS
jgi:hypothetical protein